jgi:hypothetical protein
VSGSGAEPAPSQDSEDLELEILPDGRVRIHALCRLNEDPASCALRVRAFVEGLGVPYDAVEKVIEDRS